MGELCGSKKENKRVFKTEQFPFLHSLYSSGGLVDFLSWELW